MRLGSRSQTRHTRRDSLLMWSLWFKRIASNLANSRVYGNDKRPGLLSDTNRVAEGIPFSDIPGEEYGFLFYPSCIWQGKCATKASSLEVAQISPYNEINSATLTVCVISRSRIHKAHDFRRTLPTCGAKTQAKEAEKSSRDTFVMEPISM